VKTTVRVSPINLDVALSVMNVASSNVKYPSRPRSYEMWSSHVQCLLLVVVVVCAQAEQYEARFEVRGATAGAYATQVGGVATGTLSVPAPQDARPLSAFFGLDETFPVGGAVVLGCAVAAGLDGMPVVFSQPVDNASLVASHFVVVAVSGVRRGPLCVTLRPADSPGEMRTVLLLGQLGGAASGNESDAPVTLEVVGDLLSADGVSFAGTSVAVTPLAAPPSLVLAEEMAVTAAACNAGVERSVRVTWNGGVSPDPPASSYKLRVDDGRLVEATTISDLGDNDNHHVLCFPLGQGEQMSAVTFPAGLVQDPNVDLFNIAQDIAVTPPQTEQLLVTFEFPGDLTGMSNVTIGDTTSSTECSATECLASVQLGEGLATAQITPLLSASSQVSSRIGQRIVAIGALATLLSL